MANTSDLLDVYTKLVGSQLELAKATWYPGISGEDRLKIEKVQKLACCILLGKSYKSYGKSLKYLVFDTLHERRNKLCKNFAKKSLKHPKFTKWFKPNVKKSCTRNIPTKFCDVYARTERFNRSPISYLTKLLNSK